MPPMPSKGRSLLFLALLVAVVGLGLTGWLPNWAMWSSAALAAAWLLWWPAKRSPKSAAVTSQPAEEALSSYPLAMGSATVREQDLPADSDEPSLAETIATLVAAFERLAERVEGAAQQDEDSPTATISVELGQMSAEMGRMTEHLVSLTQSTAARTDLALDQMDDLVAARTSELGERLADLIGRRMDELRMELTSLEQRGEETDLRLELLLIEGDEREKRDMQLIGQVLQLSARMDAPSGAAPKRMRSLRRQLKLRTSNAPPVVDALPAAAEQVPQPSPPLRFPGVIPPVPVEVTTYNNGQTTRRQVNLKMSGNFF